MEDKSDGKLADLIEGLKENDIHTKTATVNETLADESAKKN